MHSKGQKKQVETPTYCLMMTGLVKSKVLQSNGISNPSSSSAASTLALASTLSPSPLSTLRPSYHLSSLESSWC
ncbi:hypothetical protein VTP01DRAFT_8232 [Rhizomucor pusillus]|uniref:uncharacterized protein n=1 Tax=Rhizomucor pusillus TaxID=4840 RepID=UPI00374226D8